MPYAFKVEKEPELQFAIRTKTDIVRVSPPYLGPGGKKRKRKRKKRKEKIKEEKKRKELIVFCFCRGTRDFFLRKEPGNISS